jgi:hypothetical protein
MATGVIMITAITFVRAYPGFFGKPTPMEGLFNIAVADFGVLNAGGKAQPSNKAHWLSHWLAEQLNTSLNLEKLHIEVRHDEINHPVNDPPIGLINDKQEAEQQLTKLNADLLIYGYLTSPDDPASLQLQFAFKIKPLQSEPDATIGLYLLGQPVPIPHLNDNLYKEAVDSDPNLALRTQALLWLARGLAKDIVDDHASALKLFLQATQELPAQVSGREIFYYFQGREALALLEKPGPFALAQQGDTLQVLQGQQAQTAIQTRQARRLQRLTLAESAFLTATQISPDFVTAYIGLGNVSFNRAQLILAGAPQTGTGSSTCQPLLAPEQIQAEEVLTTSWQVALAELEHALTYYQMADTQIANAPNHTQDLASSSDSPVAKFMRGAAYRSEGIAYIKAEQQDKQTAHLLQADAKLSQAITLLQPTLQPFIQEQRYGFLAYAQYWLGEAYRAQAYIQQRQNEQAKTKTLFQQAQQYYAQCSAPKSSIDGDDRLQTTIRCYCQNQAKNVAATLEKFP